MREFDKWWEANWWELEDGGNEFKAAKQAWRAALEMVKREIFEHRESLDVIEEELI